MPRYNRNALAPPLILCACVITAQVQTPSAELSHDKPEVRVEHVSFTAEDGGLIYADVYGKSERGVVLGHGGRFTEESWQPQAQSLRVNGVQVKNAKVRGRQKGRELVITHPRLGKFAADETLTLELLELLHPHEIRSNLPNGGWRKVSLRILIALLRSGMVRVAEES